MPAAQLQLITSRFLDSSIPTAMEVPELPMTPERLRAAIRAAGDAAGRP